MSNEPIFQKLAREYAALGKSYELMTTPYLSPVKPLGTKQPLMDTPVYAPIEHLDGPYKAPLPKRNLAHLIQIPEPDPEFARRMQEFVSTAPLQILPKSDLLEKGLAERQLALYRGMVDPTIQYEIDQEAVGGTLISEENNTSTTNPKQTDKSVNAASNEENDEDDEPVILAPNFWKIRDEE